MTSGQTPVEFIGMIGTRDVSEIRPGVRAADRPRVVRRFVDAHEHGGFDQVLVGSASTPDGLQVAAYGAAHSERLGFLVAHRPGFVAPTLARAPFATLDQFSGGPRRDAHHHRRQRRRPAPRRRPPRQGGALRAHRRVPRVVKPHLDRRRAVRPPRRALPRRGRSPRGAPAPAAAHPALLRRLVDGGVPGRRQARRRVRAVGRAAGRDRRADRRGPGGGRARPGARRRPGSASRSARSSAPPRRRPGSARTTSSPHRGRDGGGGTLHRRKSRCTAPTPPANVGSQRLLAAAERGRAPRPRAVDRRPPPRPAPRATRPRSSARPRPWPRRCSTTSTSASRRS